MNSNSLILTLNQPCTEAASWMVDRARQAGHSIIRTFDLESARQAQQTFLCPYHGNEFCDCQMIVLLIYLGNSAPTTLIVHGYNNQSWISLVNTPQQRADPAVEGTIRRLFSLSTTSPIYM